MIMWRPRCEQFENYFTEQNCRRAKLSITRSVGYHEQPCHCIHKIHFGLLQSASSCIKKKEIDQMPDMLRGI